MTPANDLSRSIGLVCVLSLAVMPLHVAGYSKDDIGTAGAQFLELPVAARAAAMGSAQGAVVQNATALYYNPAGLAYVKGGNAFLTQEAYFQGISHQYAAVAQNLGKWGTCAVGVQYLSPGTLNEIDNTGIPTGNSFKPGDLAASLGYGGKIGALSLGGGVKYISSKIHDSASTFAADLGSHIRLGKLAFAASISNLGPGLKFGSKRDSLPTLLRLGSSFAHKRWLFALDAIAPRSAQIFAAAGAEYQLFALKGLAMAGRFGYNTRTASSSLGGMNGVGLGIGIARNSLGVDYAWNPYGDLGDVHLISLRFRWD